MNNFSLNPSGAKEINAAAFDFFQKTSNSWLDMISKTLGKSDDQKESGKPWPAAEIMKMWSLQPNDIVKGWNGQLPKIIAIAVKEQNNLGLAWFDYALKMMDILRRNRTQQNNRPAETLKECQELTAEYIKSCGEIIQSEWAQIAQACGLPEPKEEKSGKTETAKAKAEK